MFEIGTKGMNQKQTIRYAASLFYNAVTNIQTPRLILPDAVTITENSGNLRSFGVEVEVNAQLTNGFTIQYSGGLTNAKYLKLDDVNGGNQIDLSGNKQVFTPSSNHLIGLQYQCKIGKNDFSIRTDYVHTGTQYFDLANKIKQDAYDLLNMRTSLRMKSLEISVWARNIGGTKYIDYAYDFGAAHLGRPRTVGVGLGYRFN
jgi:iron complex outermembrane receptor protein